ncbi:TonB-dependent receptor [uncultured Alistipes sp.]|uniref:TonB-dependent receptor n=1 Tax=uncultured Alistipes sp. TaxID=538949 RepID=UPI0025F40B23|nr:TonB-dependent receptor [uncultured Alistipes sp.]
MFLKYSTLLGCLLAVYSASAQHPDDEYYPYASRQEERTPLLLTDSTLFYRAVQGTSDLYDELSGFNLPYVSTKRRGQSYAAGYASAAGVELPSRYFQAVRSLGAVEENFAGLATSGGVVGRMSGLRVFGFSDDMVEASHSAAVNFTDRNYLFGARAASRGPLGRGWSGAAAVNARTGRDMHVDGVFTNALTVSLRAAKRFGEGHDISLLIVIPPSVRGTRVSSTEEAFRLTGDNLYNPAWGFQDGKVRNSRVRREFVPLGLIAYRVPISRSTSLAATLGVEYGVRKYSAMGWYDALTPMPDNYRKMPSNVDDGGKTEQAWRSDDTHYTQIYWDELIAQNRMAVGHSSYTLEDQVEKPCNLNLDLRFETELDKRLTLYYGITFRHEQSRNYKQMRDLLGGGYITDIDQYLVDDATYGNMLQNDLRHPDRTIRRGDRFAYDYALSTRRADLRLVAEYRADRLRADLALSLGDAAIRRRGYYEKELFPGAQSYGRSRRMKFTPYTIKALAGWAFSPRSYLFLSAAVQAALPDAADLFFQPLYNNRTIDDPGAEHTYAAELNYSRTGDVLTLRLTAYALGAFDGTETRRYYDDMATIYAGQSGVYADMAVTGIGRMAYGVEAAARIRLSYRWSLSLSGAAGRYKYIRDPRVTVISDVDNSVVDAAAVSHMKDCTIGGAPQLTASAELGYFGPKGWGFRASAGYAGARYVEPSYLRRTERIARQGGLTPELFEAFTRQERLGDAFTLDAALFKTFYFGPSRLTASLSLRNLLGGKDTVYSGYESLRVQRIPSGDTSYYTPHATRYTYAYPRSFYLTVSYKF